ncbi:laminin subunit alpha-4 [Eurytemora carolleeae]|uniref:laminin subunit alpha-4 n=1 Tax=Eurytemora carolleeae TaxID=1294199 RepID=UPI000C7778A9|nr:laminin subunit alpha-4 [Eurytemora carolleeae]XP_023330077.1 laminin subunit alpha-4 [Eurytemora carolleeae]|eukprot:XP_023330076.1 laminin subunit alpha-4-like [Eurytemora affinis]
MGQPSDAERVIFWTKWRLMSWYSAALNQGSKVGCYTSKRLIISLCIAGLIVLAAFNVLSGAPTSKQMQDKALIRKSEIDQEVLEALGLSPVPGDQEVPGADELPPVPRYKDSGVLKPPGNKVQDNQEKERDKSLQELIEEEMQENIKKGPVGQPADIARMKDKFADDHLLHRKKRRENLELIQEEKKENQEKSGEKEKNVDSIKLTKSFVTLEEKKKLLSEKKEDEDDEEEHDLSKKNIPKVKEKINQIKKNFKTSDEETVLQPLDENPDVKISDINDAMKNSDIKLSNIDDTLENPDVKLSNIDDTMKNPDVKLSNINDTMKNPDAKLSNIDETMKNPDVKLSNIDDTLKNPDVKLSNIDDTMKNPDIKLSNKGDDVEQNE